MKAALSLAVFFIGAVFSFAQTATLTADQSRLSARGGQVVLTATVLFDQTPGALGWKLDLPEGWVLLQVSGPEQPTIAPSVGAMRQLEFAYINVPSSFAQFSCTLLYPAGIRSGQLITGQMLYREANIGRTVNVSPVELAEPLARSEVRKSHAD